MIVARSVGIACLKVFAYLLFALGVLLALLTVVQHSSGDPLPQVYLLGAMAIGVIAGGFLSLRAARRLAAMG